MIPLYFYITRPTAYEIYMGGKRNLELWADKPLYSHEAQEHEYLGKMHYVDKGWFSNHSRDVNPHDIFTQDEELLNVIWYEVFTSVLPRGMTYEEGMKWRQEKTSLPPSHRPFDNNYQLLVDDPEWEAKCNTCHKRLLLKVDVRSNEVTRVIPDILLRNVEGELYIDHRWTLSDQCERRFAVEYYQDHPYLDDIF